MNAATRHDEHASSCARRPTRSCRPRSRTTRRRGTATLQPSARAELLDDLHRDRSRRRAPIPRVTSAAGARARRERRVVVHDRRPAPAATTYTIWTSVGDSRDAPAAADTSAVELGVKFRSDRDGYITGIRFYKGTTNTGHPRRQSLDGRRDARSASVTFANETASGWQQATFASPIAITANTVYVASYYAPVGRYAVNAQLLHAARRQRAAPRARELRRAPTASIAYGATQRSSRTSRTTRATTGSTWSSWTRSGADTTPPTSSARQSPDRRRDRRVDVDGRHGDVQRADRPGDDHDEHVRAAHASERARRRRRSPTTPRRARRRSSRRRCSPPSTIYTVTVRGGVDGSARQGRSPATRSRPTPPGRSRPPPIPANEGPGGPILVVASTANPFSRYYGEILRTEGLNVFTVTDISLVTAPTLEQRTTWSSSARCR